MWNGLLSILKYVCKEKLLFLVGLPKSFSTQKTNKLTNILVPLVAKWFL